MWKCIFYDLYAQKINSREGNHRKKYIYVTELLTLGHVLTSPLPKTKFTPQSEGAGHKKSRASCLQDLFSRWVIPTEAWPILNEMAVGQQIPAGLHCIIQLFWTHAPAVSELAAAIELLLPPICTQRIERLLQPCPHCLSSILPRANWAQEPRQRLSSISRQPMRCRDDIWPNVIPDSHDGRQCACCKNAIRFHWCLIELNRIRAAVNKYFPYWLMRWLKANADIFNLFGRFDLNSKTQFNLIW